MPATSRLNAAAALLCLIARAFAAANACNLTGAWNGGDSPVSVVMSDDYSFVATAGSNWQNQPGQYWPSNASLFFSCCGGMTGSISGDCNTISWADAHSDVWSRGPTPAGSASIASPLLSVGVAVHASGAVSINLFSFFGAGANTSNLALDGGGGTTASSTLVVPAGLAGTGGGALVPRCGGGCTLTSTSTSMTLTGLDLGGFANETWTLTLLNASAFEWRADRVYHSSGGPALGVDRIALSLATTGGQPIHSEQIPGFVDLDMFLNASSTGGFDIGNSAFEFLSPHARQFVRMTPTGALFVVEGAATRDGAPAPALFSFAKPFADGTAWCSVGFELVDPRGAPPPPPAPGSRQSATLTMHLVETDIPTGAGAGPFPAMDVALSNATLGAQMAQLLGAQYQLLGWLMGNNPASVPCLHEMAWWPMMASLFPAGSVAFPAMQRQLSFFAGCGWAPFAWADHPGQYQHVHSCNASGDGARFGLMQRYASSGFYNCPWGPLTDEDVMFPIAVYYLATSTGDTAWLRSLLPALRAIESFLAAAGLTLDGPPAAPVVYVSPASGLADGQRHAANWYDVVLFGHLDAYLAAHGVWALACLAEMYEALGDDAGAARAAAVHARAVADFNAVFWNASTASYHDWIDAGGRKRAYFYTDIAFVAVIAGIADGAQTAALLGHYDARLAEIYAAYNVTPGSIWSAPCNLYPVTDPLEYANAPGAMTFPMYENGGAFFHTPGLQFAALGVAGRADDAYTGFVTLMNSGFGRIRGWAQQLYWAPNGGPESLVGGDPLNTAALSVWGFMRAAFGAAPTLTRGVVAVNAPAAAAEGSRWNISVLGENVCLRVRGGATAFCNGSALSPK